MVLFYIFVTLINCIPYIDLNIFQGNILEQLLNSWFESISATSTTGLTLMEGITIPQTLMLSRSLNEWVGGIGIIFILLSSFYPSRKLDEYSKAIGFEKLSRSYRGTFLIVLIIYVTYTLIFAALLMLSGLDIFTSFHTVFTVFSTTGYTIISASSMPLSAVAVITLMMFSSGLSFVFHFKLLLFIKNIEWKKLLSRKPRRILIPIAEMPWKTLFTIELKGYLILIAALTIAFWIASGTNPFQSFYHVVDFSSSCGLGVVDFPHLGDAAKMLLVVAMFIGPMSFSIGGGVRVQRVIIFAKTLLNLPKALKTRKIPKIEINGETINSKDISFHLLVIGLFALISIVGAWSLTFYSYNSVDAIVESVSAITTTGDSPTVLTPAFPLFPKLMLMMLMLVGRMEILPVFMAFSRGEIREDVSRF